MGFNPIHDNYTTRQQRRRLVITGSSVLLLMPALAGVAAAAPDEWDIGMYDACVKVATTTDEKDRCCIGSGGQIGGGMNPDGSFTCASPLAEEQTFNPTLPNPFDPETAGVSDDPIAGAPLPTPKPPSGYPDDRERGLRAAVEVDCRTIAQKGL